MSSFLEAIPNIPANAKWIQNGVTVAGGNWAGNVANQLYYPHGLFVDGDQTVIIADNENHRIIQWKKDDTTHGQIVAGGNGQENQLNQLAWPTDVLVDKESDSLIICDYGNCRVVRWLRRSDTTQGEILIENVKCYGLAMDDQKYLYVSDAAKHEQNVYVTDYENHRVMKWAKGATEGIVVAGGQCQGNSMAQLSYPNGLFVDTLGTVYVADSNNYRVMRWPQGAKQGTVIVGGKDWRAGANQFLYLRGLSFDQHGNLYVVDNVNNRVQRFSFE
ncbi:unnamed protein product [Rotaria socialis]|uniref:NHL repeat-containing protein n=3 Tax=Rotaria TaxID=231623 RepID=A0A821T956_9BILA|nr:unnamed protein product [Rotaria socialis]